MMQQNAKMLTSDDTGHDSFQITMTRIINRWRCYQNEAVLSEYGNNSLSTLHFRSGWLTQNAISCEMICYWPDTFSRNLNNTMSLPTGNW